MSKETNQKEYFETELEKVEPVLSDLGFFLEEYQPHISGEKKLMQAVTTESGKKLILLGRRKKDKKKVLIKVTKDSSGIKEINHERKCRDSIKNIKFSYKNFFSPKEILYKKKKGYVISIQEYIDQKGTFLTRPLKDQFFLTLRSFKTQESAHATTYKHRRDVSKVFGYADSDWYIKSYGEFQKNITEKLPKDKKLFDLLEKGRGLLLENKETIEQYCNFLTHTDFVPHNFRIVNDNIYLLDHSSIRFGNKYEGWARFLNFMTLYNRPLEEALLFYIQKNRTREEVLSLKLMRVYRLGEIIWYYTNLLPKTSGDLNKLTEERIQFWASVLESTLEDKLIELNKVQNYKNKRDLLRSEEEKLRQKKLH